jgi:hypothetical protein
VSARPLPQERPHRADHHVQRSYHAEAVTDEQPVRVAVGDVEGGHRRVCRPRVDGRVLVRWWNPAVEAQAVDRTHRIGQDKTVMVYRLVAADTVEQKVVALQERERDLFARVLDDDSALAGPLTAEDIRGLFA